MRTFFLILLATLLFSCISPKPVDKIEFQYQFISFTSISYEETNKDDIQIFNAIKNIPGRYEEIGVFKITSDVEINYEALKTISAKYGGHGLLPTTRGIILIRIIEYHKEEGNDVKI